MAPLNPSGFPLGDKLVFVLLNYNLNNIIIIIKYYENYKVLLK